MIHTNTFMGYRMSLNLLMEPKLIKSPSGKANKRVRENIFNVIPKPSRSDIVTLKSS